MKYHVLVIQEFNLWENKKKKLMVWSGNDLKAIEYKTEEEALTYIRALNKRFAEQNSQTKRRSAIYKPSLRDDEFEFINI